MKKIYLAGLFTLAMNLYNSFSQSLYEDVQTLLHAVNILEGKTLTTDPDAAKIQAAGVVIAVLQQYDNNLPNETIRVGSWEELRRRYAKNPLIKRVLHDSLPFPPAQDEAAVAQAARASAQQLNAGLRQEVLQKLYAPQAVSPADYLSTPNALVKYQTPVLPQMDAMLMAAENSNDNVQQGALISQAAVIEGLAKFILSRAKDEVVINFLDRLLKDEVPDLKQLFPTVVAEFSEAEFTYTEPFIDRLRQAFYEDLQKLSVRLPLLMLEDEYFEPLQADPVAYNVMAIYSLIGQLQLDAPVESAVPATNRYLYELYAEKTKELNLVLAENAWSSDEYQALIATAQQLNDQIKTAFQALSNAESNLDGQIIDFQDKFQNAPFPPNVVDYLGSAKYDLNVLWGDGKFGLNLLPQLLNGQFDSAFMASVNTLANYDKYFSEDLTADQMRGAGLELAQQLNGGWYHGESIAGILQDWLKDLERYRLAVDRWMVQADAAGTFQRATQDLATDIQNLRQVILEDKAFWQQNSKLDNNRKLAFDVLHNCLNNNALSNIETLVDIEAVTDSVVNANKAAVVYDRKKGLVMSVLDRLVSLDSSLYVQNSKLAMASPLRKYRIAKRTAKPYAGIEANIQALGKSLTQLQRTLVTLENTYADQLRRERDNAKPFLQVTEFGSTLMYCLLSNNPNQKWLTRAQLNEVLDGGDLEALFLGLLQQRLGQINGIAPLSTPGLAEFVRLTLEDVSLLPDPAAPVKDSLADYKKAAFSMNILNRALELPLVKDHKTGQFAPLIDRWPNLARIPDISSQLLNFVYYLNIKNHGQAISSLIRLFCSFDVKIKESNDPKKQKKQQKRADAIAFLQKYGDFIAGLIDAKTGDEVKSLLNLIADPPGSSSLKRTNALTVSLNGYLGANVGNERWSGEALATDRSFWSLAPTMPVGAALAGRLGRKGPSMSLYIAFLDLGALINYAPDSNQAASNYNFKNMFKPGVQVHWNLNRSPFYIGAGWQYGPQSVTVGERTDTVGANRYFLSFGVDTPILTLYRR